MRKIIHNKVYDTETACRVCDPVSPNGMYDVRDFHYFEETLYRKKTGEYFLHGHGGPLSPYAEPYGQTGSQGGERIVPFTPEQAREWAEEHLDAEDYEAEFGTPSEDGSTALIQCYIAAATKAEIDRRRFATGKTIADVIEDAIERTKE